MKTIGIIGGGQLGLMLAQQARLLGARTICLDPAADAPAFAECDEYIVASFDDALALEELCRRSDVVTYEFENVPGQVLLPLVEKYNIPQGFRPLYDSQDRVREKNNARQNRLRTPDFSEVIDLSSLREGIEKLGFPCVFKTRSLGYDGHGQVLLRSEADIEKTLPYLNTPAILEQFIAFDYEVSVIMVSDGQNIISFPVGQNIHRDGILDICVVPATKMSDALAAKITRQSEDFMRACGYVGILAIEYFVKGDEVYFNEMAPRPHNSGHYTIEGSTTNQFRELCRFLLGEPLRQPELVAPTVMKNILGQDTQAARRIEAEADEKTFVHLYGKSVCKPKRKMGHITFVETTLEEYERKWAGEFV